MPVFEYQCEADHISERIASAASKMPRRIKCECGKWAKRILSRPSFILKGPGFHHNDYTKHGPKRK